MALRVLLHLRAGMDVASSVRIVEMVPLAGIEPASPPSGRRIEGAAVLRVSRSGTVQFTTRSRMRTRKGTGSWRGEKELRDLESPRSPVPEYPPVAISPVLRNAPNLLRWRFHLFDSPDIKERNPNGPKSRGRLPFSVTAVLKSSPCLRGPLPFFEARTSFWLLHTSIARDRA